MKGSGKELCPMVFCY